MKWLILFFLSYFGYNTVFAQINGVIFHYYEKTAALDFNAGILPYKKGERWGFVDTKDSLVLQPMYTSLLYAGKGLCLAMNEEGIVLLREDLTRLFESKATDVRAIMWFNYNNPVQDNLRNGFVFKDSQGRKKWHKILTDGTVKIFYDSLRMLNDVEYQNGLWQPKVKDSYSYIPQSKVFDSLVIKHFRDSSTLDLYNKGATKHRNIKQGLSFQFQQPHFLEIHKTWDENFFTLYNLSTQDSIHGPGIFAQVFSKQNQNYFIVYTDDYGSKTAISFILNEKGDTLMNVSGYVHESNGMLIQKLIKDGGRGDHIHLYSIPEFKRIASNLRDEGHWSPYFTKVHDWSGNYLVFSPEGKLVYKGRGKPDESQDEFDDVLTNSEGSFGALIITPRKEQSKNQKSRLFSSSGKLLYETDSLLTVDNNYQSSPIIILTILEPERKGKIVQGYKKALLDLEKESLRFTPYVHIEEVVNGIFTAVKANDSIVLINAEGQQLLPTVFEEFYKVQAGKRILLVGEQKQQYLFYDSLLNRIQVPDSIYSIGEMRNFNRYNYNSLSSNFFVFRSKPKLQLCGILNEKLEVVVPCKYRQIELNEKGGYFFAIDANNEPVYLRLNGTELRF